MLRCILGPFPPPVVAHIYLHACLLTERFGSGIFLTIDINLLIAHLCLFLEMAGLCLLLEISLERHPRVGSILSRKVENKKWKAGKLSPPGSGYPCLNISCSTWDKRHKTYETSPSRVGNSLCFLLMALALVGGEGERSPVWILYASSLALVGGEGGEMFCAICIKYWLTSSSINTVKPSPLACVAGVLNVSSFSRGKMPGTFFPSQIWLQSFQPVMIYLQPLRVFLNASCWWS